MPPSLVSPLAFLWLREHGGFRRRSPLRQFPEENQTPPELITGRGFCSLPVAMIFSGYLMYLLAFKIKAVCLYCVVSALLSLSLFTLALIGRDCTTLGNLFLRDLWWSRRAGYPGCVCECE